MAEAGPSGLDLGLPASWIDLDLDPATRDGSIRRLAEQRAAPGLDAAVAERQLNGATAGAAAAGAVYAAMYSDVLEGRPVSASLVVSLTHGRPGGPPAPPGAPAGAVAEGIRRMLASGGGDVEVRRLPAGPAVRVRRRAKLPVPAPGAGAAGVESVQYFVPWRGGLPVAVLAFSTPTVGLADAFTELFDAIAGTLSWT